MVIRCIKEKNLIVSCILLFDSLVNSFENIAASLVDQDDFEDLKLFEDSLSLNAQKVQSCSYLNILNDLFLFA